MSRPVPQAHPPLAEAQEKWVQAAWEQVDRGHLRELAVAVTDIASPTGEEAELAAMLVERLAATGARATLQPLDATSANAVGRLPGTGDGADLLLFAPIDTLTTGNDAEDIPAVARTLPPYLRARAMVSGDLVSGLGASNPKGHAACVLAAVEALAAAAVPLRGDVLAGFGAGGMPTNARPGQNRRNVGHGVGCSFLLEQGGYADFAIIAKPGWTVSVEEVGLAWFEVRVNGTHTYVGSRHRIPYRNAIADAAGVVVELEHFFAEYTARHTAGTWAPQGIVASIEGGLPRMAAVTPATVVLRVDLRLAPGMSVMAARREFADAMRALPGVLPGVDVDWDLVVAVPGSASPRDCFVAGAARAAWEQAEGRPHAEIDGMSGATDANILRNRGIPTVRVGMPKVPDLGFSEGMNTVDVREMERLTRLLIRVAIDVCTRPLDEVLAAGASA